MDEPLVLSERIGRVGVLTLNRPRQLNALSDALMDALGDGLLELDADAGIGAIVIKGGAKAFAAGADIAAMSDWTYTDAYQSEFIARNWETIRHVRKPVIAAVCGYAMGGGCELALAAPAAWNQARIPRTHRHAGSRIRACRTARRRPCASGGAPRWPTTWCTSAC